MEEDEKKSKGFLSKAFKFAAWTIPIAVAAAVGWQMFLDPQFFPLFHDNTNVMAQAWRLMINDYFGWIPKMLGLSGDGGLLHTPIAQSFLQPYIDQVPHVSTGIISGATGAGTEISMDALETLGM